MKKIKKLKLSSETVRNVSVDALQEVVGGGPTPSFIYSCNVHKCTQPDSGMTCPSNVAC